MKINDYVTCAISRTKFCPGAVYDLHCHIKYELIFVLQGSADFNIEGEKITLSENMAILIPPLKYHIVSGRNGVYDRLVIEFDKDFIPPQILPDFKTAVKLSPIISSKEAAECLGKIAGIAELKEPDAFFPLFKGLLIQTVYAYAFENPAPAASGGKNKTDTQSIKGIIRYIDKNLSGNIMLKQIAEHNFISVSSLCHIFKREMKISVKQYILKKKMYYAAGLINKGVSPTAAAKLCGYDNYASFYKIFLKTTGSTPSQTARK